MAVSRSHRRPSNLPFLSQIVEDRITEKAESEHEGSQETKEVPKRTAAELDMFMRFSGVVERHLGDMSCILGCIMEAFVHWFSRKYSEGQNLQPVTLVRQAKNFVILLKETVIDYYQLHTFGG